MKHFAYGLGLAYGVIVLGLLYALKQTVAEPIVEWLLEFYEQQFVRPSPSETRTSAMSARGEIVIVSDLHVDTWDRAAGGREERERLFSQFLRAIEPTTMELYINGDLIDAPPNPNDRWDGNGFSLRGSILPKYEGVLASLSALNNQTPIPVLVTLLYGNHDMAASGLRYDLVKRPQLLQHFHVPFNMSWYPNMILGLPMIPENEGREEYRFYIDHGHFYDPVLLLYLRDFVAAALRSDLQRAMTALVISGQRRSSERQGIPMAGLGPPARRTLDQRIGHWLVRYRWRWKARRVLADRNAAELRQQNRPLSGVLFGHTHIPDRYMYRIWGARGMTYVNTGDWMGDTGHGTYTVITQDGVMTQHDWLDPGRRAPHHQLGGTNI